MRFRTQLGLFWLIAIPIYLLWELKTGDEAWQQRRAEFLAAGGTLERASRLADAVPDEDNFGAISELRGITRQDEAGADLRSGLEQLGLRHPTAPLPRTGRRKLHQTYRKLDLQSLHEYFGSTGVLPITEGAPDLAADMLRALEEQHGETISAMLVARDRPHAKFLPLMSEVLPEDEPLISQSAPHLQTTLRMAGGLKLFAILNLRTGDRARAADSIGTVFRISEAIGADGKSLITHLVAIATSSVAMPALWEGLESRAWDDGQLAGLQQNLARLDWRASASASIHAELLIQLDLYDQLRKNPRLAEDALDIGMAPIPTFLLDGMLSHNKATTLRLLHHYAIRPLDAGLPYLETRALCEASDEILSRPPRWNPRKIFAALAVPTTSSMMRKTAEHETHHTQAATACALERYYLVHHSYPESLGALNPEFTDALPLDPMDHQPMRYRKTDDGRYQLHSVGWDGEDNQGGEGDITWNYQSRVP